MRHGDAPSPSAMQIAKLVGMALIMIIVVFVGVLALVNQLQRESAILEESSQLIVELLDEQGVSYRAPATFTYHATCGDELEYRPPTNRPMPGGRGTIPILCPSKIVTELRISILPADPACSTPVMTTPNAVSGLTLRYQVTCTR